LFTIHISLLSRKTSTKQSATIQKRKKQQLQGKMVEELAEIIGLCVYSNNNNEKRRTKVRKVFLLAKPVQACTVIVKEDLSF
jgi:hypothetical protein